MRRLYPEQGTYSQYNGKFDFVKISAQKQLKISDYENSPERKSYTKSLLEKKISNQSRGLGLYFLRKLKLSGVLYLAFAYTIQKESLISVYFFEKVLKLPIHILKDKLVLLFVKTNK